MIHAAAIQATNSVPPDRQPRLTAVEVEELKDVVVLPKYVDFADVFSVKEANKFPPRSADDCCIPTKEEN